ncbi:protein of unknown function DUF1058 [Desulfurispirillum indicum S5]|uniref:SH3b domain-containing protein n=1 Tax=Desulfurispirillum indicum (strain ATCC BAA-1389 / DSM 22839 / S5) TaxID=653733 RepID=E6W6Z6_DESIS|nr:SH3 domain-containing protein [Desulfurispirillum indicum]ADU66239.1 protein of unknown function DUF1058 [Desulfurispirillum indicum S5]
MKKLLLLFIFIHTLVLTAIADNYVAVTGDRVNLRAQPSTNAEVLWTLGKYFPLKVLKQQGNWYQVEDFEGDKGWIHNSVANKENRGVIVIRNNVNVRSSNSTNSDILFRTSYGVAFRIIGQRSNWYQVEHPDGHQGWIRGDLLWGAK